MAAKLSLNKRTRLFSIFIAIIPTHLVCQIQGDTSGVEFLTKRKKTSLSFVFVYVP